MKTKLLFAAALLSACASNQPKTEPSAQAAHEQGTADSAAHEQGAQAAAAPQHGAHAAAAPQQGAQGTPDAEFRAQPPKPGAPVEFHAPVPKQLELSNGVPVYFIERHDLPLVTVSLAVRSGADTAPPGKAGLPSFALALLDEGTQTRDAAAIATSLEGLAATLQKAPDADATTLSVSALSDTLEPVLAIFADVALHPAFRAADVERVRKVRLGEVAQQLEDPPTIGRNVLSRMLYGEKHPLALPEEGTVDSLGRISAKDLAAWHKASFVPSNSAIFVVGNTSEQALMAALEKSFAGWKGAARNPAHAQAAPKAAQRTTVYVVDKPDAPQSQIWIGELGIAASAADQFPVRVMNTILGGSFNSRLNGNLRTEHAYSYGVGSAFVMHRSAGPFFATGGVVAAKTGDALAEFFKELDKMKTGEVTDAELADAKDGLVQTIPALFASTSATADAYARAWVHGLPLDYYATYQQRIQAVTKDDVAQAARQHLHPENMAVVVVGPRAQLEGKLPSLKLGALELRDATGQSLAAAAASARNGGR